MQPNSPLSSIEEVIEDARNGKMFILVDDEERENEGDLIIPAQMATPKAINFMATHGRGLICLTLTQKRVDDLKLPLMAQQNGTRHGTAFTVSIEAKEGVSTGISAPDRAHTIATAIDPTKGAGDIVSPGHIFPLAARDGGVLVRAGHTEASVDIARLSGLNPSSVICEILSEDGTMARMPELCEFATKHDLRIATIADLIAYRRRTETLVQRGIESEITSHFGGTFRTLIYTNTIEYAEHIVLIKGSINPNDSVWVRIHVSDVLHDALGDAYHNKYLELQHAMQMIDQHGAGVIILIREPRKDRVSTILETRKNPPQKTSHALKDYGIGAQILLDLGIHHMTLLTNSHPSAVGLEGYGLIIDGYQRII